MTTLQDLASGNRVPTGIAGFDEIMNGGLPRGGFTVVMGSAGAGKTVFAFQFRRRVRAARWFRCNFHVAPERGVVIAPRDRPVPFVA